MGNYHCYRTTTGSLVVKEETPTPLHRLTGIQCYYPKEDVIDEWARVQKMREDGHPLVIGGQHKEPTKWTQVIQPEMRPAKRIMKTHYTRRAK